LFWYEQRALELSRAINDYLTYGDFEKAHQWAIELNEVLNMAAHCKKQGIK